MGYRIVPPLLNWCICSFIHSISSFRADIYSTLRVGDGNTKLNKIETLSSRNPPCRGWSGCTHGSPVRQGRNIWNSATETHYGVFMDCGASGAPPMSVTLPCTSRLALYVTVALLLEHSCHGLISTGTEICTCKHLPCSTASCLK